jgi:hypothetical protein
MLIYLENFLCELSYNILCQILDVILIGHMISVSDFQSVLLEMFQYVLIFSNLFYYFMFYLCVCMW